jgi:RecQ family ATP-dependent DNA helicase
MSSISIKNKLKENSHNGYQAILSPSHNKNDKNNNTLKYKGKRDIDEEVVEKMDYTLKNVFKLKEFRKNQFQIMKQLIKDRRDTFVLMPTGAGKSLCYQLPACVFNGVTLVISPLIALMHNQVQALRKLRIEANFWTSKQSKKEIDHIKKDLQGEPKNISTKLLYVAPELLSKNEYFKKLITQVYNKGALSLIAIDESHCISEWGHDFRPDYRAIGILKQKYPNVPMIALTATATTRVKHDIVKNLRLKNVNEFHTSFNRPNIFYEIRNKDAIYSPISDLTSFLNKYKNECGIIYCRTKKQVDQLVYQLQDSNFLVKRYYSTVPDKEKKKTQSDWIKGEKLKIIVATIAFGMGIDKKNVRFVGK